MSIVTDVGRDLAGLKIDRKVLRKFGLMVGAVFLLLGAWIYWHKHEVGLGSSLGGVGAVLILFGAVAPASLRPVYRVWMGLAMTLGWFVSRVLLVVLFFGFVVPIGLLARVVGKRFLDLPARSERESMWIPRPAKTPNYERMY